jgi:hypothetical protein
MVEHKDRTIKFMRRDSKDTKLESISEENHIVEAILNMMIEKKDSIHSDTINSEPNNLRLKRGYSEQIVLGNQ